MLSDLNLDILQFILRYPPLYSSISAYIVCFLLKITSSSLLSEFSSLLGLT